MLNRCVTTPVYVYHFVLYLRGEFSVFGKVFGIGGVSWSLSFLGLVQFFVCFAIYDLVYYWFHRILHQQWIYKYIHKHHHHQISPFRGTFDGINTHPFEFLFGEYLHLWSVMGTIHFTGSISGPALVGFIFSSSLMASLNHTRHAVNVPLFFDVRDHDLHHRLPRSNYGQFVMWWDHLFGTYQPYYGPPQRREAEEAATVAMRAKEAKWRGCHQSSMGALPLKACVTGANGLLGRRLVSRLLQEGVKEIVAVDLRLPTLEEQRQQENQRKAATAGGGVSSGYELTFLSPKCYWMPLMPPTSTGKIKRPF